MTIRTDQFADFHAATWQAEHRLSLAPAVANGAAVLALAGIVGNVADPDAALRALSVPLGLFGLGLACGSAAAHKVVGAASRLSAVVMGVVQLDASNRQLEAAQEAVEERDPQSAEELTKANEELKAVRERLRSNRDDLTRLTGLKDEASRETTAGRWLIRSSVVCMVAGFVALLAGHALGLIQLQPHS